MRRSHSLVALGAFVAASLTSATVARAAETCGDGLDNDSDSLADEGCFPGGGVTADPLSELLTGSVPRATNVRV